MAEFNSKEKWRMAKFRPAMDFGKVCFDFMIKWAKYVQAKMVIGLSSSTKAEELDQEEIHQKFVKKLALVIFFIEETIK